MNSKNSSLIGIGTVAFIVSVIGILIILGLFATFAIIFNPFVHFPSFGICNEHILG
ncbi:MAG: hypothetical protein ACM3ZS_04440 [Nitrososphaerota archaeon]|nr:hypothetical protein [Nitrososphaeraceae archaeon]